MGSELPDERPARDNRAHVLEHELAVRLVLEQEQQAERAARHGTQAHSGLAGSEHRAARGLGRIPLHERRSNVAAGGNGRGLLYRRSAACGHHRDE